MRSRIVRPWGTSVIGVLRCIAVSTVICVGLPAPAQEDNPTIDVDSPITTVTVFRQQANVIREIEVNAGTERQFLRVSGLPHTIQHQSVRWESDADITVRSLRVTPHRVTADDGKNELREQELAQRNAAVQEASHRVAVIEQDLETIEDLVEFSSAKTNEDLNRSKLESQTVTELADFVMQRRRTLSGELHVARIELQTLQKKADEVMRQSIKDTKPKIMPTFDATLMVDAPQGGLIRLNYWVDEVYWEPHYTIHATADEDGPDHFVIQLDGTVMQNSGEDWNGVELAFCTGQPDLRAENPLLVPLRVAVDQGDQEQIDTSDLFDRAQRRSDAPSTWEDLESWNRNVSLNARAAIRQVFEINRHQSVQRDLADDAANNVTDETYRVAGRLDIANQPAEQAITILRCDIQSPIYRVVTPLLSSFGYREASIENTTGQSLVGGEATVILNGQFVGRTTLPPTAAGGEFAVGLGADRQVRTRRELTIREDSIQGGNRRSKLQYRLVIANYHASEINIRLYDRIPITSDSSTINVVADTNTLGELSADAKYLRLQRPTGILRWDLTIPAKRFGSNAYDHHFGYTIEMDRTQSIVSNDLEQQLRNDLRFNQSGGGGMGGGMGGFGGNSGGSF